MTDAELRAETQRLRELLALREADAQVAARALDDFMSHAVHDIRSSLGVIGSYAGLLQKRHAPHLDAQGQEFVQAIRAGSKRLAQQVDGWRTYARAAGQPLRREAVAPEPLVRAAYEQLQADGAAPHRPVLDVAPLPAACGDPDLLALLWRHLVANAVKFTRHASAPRIAISGEARGDRALYRVEDNGAGFDVRDAARLFVPFGRLHEEREFAGTGIGLALVRDIATRHGGKVRAEAAPGHGATFHLELPLAG